MAVQVARMTMQLANDVHRTDAGRRIVLDHQWRQIYADPSTDMRIIAPAQRGKTLYQLVKTFAQLMLDMSVGWVMPKYGKVQELVNGKLNPTIKATPEYAELQRMSEGTDTMQLKTFGKFGKLYIVTANSPDDLTSFSADAMHIDERDFCNRQNLPMYPARMNASPYKLTDEISTPTIEGSKPRLGERGIDNIHSEFLAGDQYRYFTPCPYCGMPQILDWYENVVICDFDDSGRIIGQKVRDQDWSPGSPMDLRVCCSNPKCGHPFDRLTPGEWVSLNRGKRVRSYWVEALATGMGPTVTTMMETFQRALGNPSKMQHFHNMDLGRPYSGGLTRFSPDLFERCTEVGRRMASSSDGPCTMGIDVNRPWLDVHVSRWTKEGQIKLFVAKLRADPEELVRLARRFNITVGVIDNQPEAKFAADVQEELMRRAGCAIIRCNYATNEQKKPLVISEPGKNPKLDAPRLVTAHRLFWIDTIYEMMLLKKVSYFEEWRSVPTEEASLLDDFMGPVRQLVIDDNGNEKFVWKGGADHQLHAAVYDRLAAEVMGMNLMVDISEVIPQVNHISHGGVTPARTTMLDIPMILRG